MKKLRFFPLSDFHAESYPQYEYVTLPRILNREPDDFDYVLVAGDLTVRGDPKYAIPFLQSCKDAGKHCFFILGNHDYYGKYASKAVGAWQQAIIDAGLQDDVTLLSADDPDCSSEAQVTSVIVEDSVLVVGSTLWTNNGSNPVLRAHIDANMPDSHFIDTRPGNREGFNGKYQAEAFRTAFYGITREIIRRRREGFTGKVILMIHHCPTFQAVSEEFRRDSLEATIALNSGFVQDLEWWIDLLGIDHVHFGHIHAAWCSPDMKYICNPVGYASEAGTGFNPNLILEV